MNDIKFDFNKFFTEIGHVYKELDPDKVKIIQDIMIESLENANENKSYFENIEYRLIDEPEENAFIKAEEMTI